MKIVQINATCGIGSTGKICVGISNLLSKENIENYIISSKSNGYELGIVCSNEFEQKLQALKSKVLGNYGFNSNCATSRIIDVLDEINPDIVHLHNIHGHDCNIEKLFSYFKAKRIKLIWTFHDCWSFTGYCTYFSMTKCDKWQDKCNSCIQRKNFSWFFDRSAELFNKKKKLFSGLDLTIVTPSQWLADLVKQSFLKDYPVKVVSNGISIEIFQPTDGDFRQRNGLENKNIILGISNVWEKRKGLDVFIELAKRLPEEYKIVLVGTNDETDKILPDNIVSIHRTNNQKELAEIYTAADVFVNPTREEVFGLTNVEALACGTPGITFRSGGSPECYDETCGSVVDCDDIDAMEREIIRICEEKPYSKEACIKKAQEFDQNERFNEYVKLYSELMLKP